MTPHIEERNVRWAHPTSPMAIVLRAVGLPAPPASGESEPAGWRAGSFPTWSWAAGQWAFERRNWIIGSPEESVASLLQQVVGVLGVEAIEAAWRLGGERALRVLLDGAVGWSGEGGRP